MPAWHLSRVAPTGTRAIGCGVPAWRPPLPAPLRPRRPRNAPRLSLARRAGGPPGADAVGVGVAAWAGRDGRLCLGELTPAGGPGARGGATLVPGRALDLLPGEAVLQARTRGTCHAAGRCRVQIQVQIQLQQGDIHVGGSQALPGGLVAFARRSCGSCLHEETCVQRHVSMSWAIGRRPAPACVPRFSRGRMAEHRGRAAHAVPLCWGGSGRAMATAAGRPAPPVC